VIETRIGSGRCGKVVETVLYRTDPGEKFESLKESGERCGEIRRKGTGSMRAAIVGRNDGAAVGWRV